MEHDRVRVHQLIAAGIIDAENEYDFWINHWHHIASAKLSLEMKIATYEALKLHTAADINLLYIVRFYEMMCADRAFVAALDMDAGMRYCYRVLSACLDDDVEALTRYSQELTDDGASAWDTHRNYYLLGYALIRVVMEINAPRCIRFLFQDKGLRELASYRRLPPLMQRLLEELVQPTDWLDKACLLYYGQSVKLMGMCVKDEELVEAWLSMFMTDPPSKRICPSVIVARKLHALATPEQSGTIRIAVLLTIYDEGGSSDGCFELASLFGLLGPCYPKVQECFLKNNVNWFPAFSFAMIVAMCDGYLGFKHEITTSQRRFFTLVARLPMDLQALVSLRLWGRAATVIQAEKFDRAFLAII
jgi:hypothetical protein